MFFIHYFQFTQLISQELYKLQNSYTSKTYQNYSTLYTISSHEVLLWVYIIHQTSYSIRTVTGDGSYIQQKKHMKI